MTDALDAARERMENFVYQTLDVLLFRSWSEVERETFNSVRSLRHFGPAWPLHSQSQLFFHPQEFTQDVLWPFQVCSFQPKDDGPWRFQLADVRSIKLSEARGKVARVFPKMLRAQIASFSEDGRCIAYENFFGWGNGKWIDCLHEYSNTYKGTNLTGTMFIPMMQSIALNQRYDWSAVFSLDGSHPVRLQTDTRGVLALFSDREKPESGDRRPAIRHWVKEHFRRRRSSLDEYTTVRAHLRGNMKFNWRGFAVQICPSDYDRQKNGERINEFMQEALDA